MSNVITKVLKIRNKRVDFSQLVRRYTPEEGEMLNVTPLSAEPRWCLFENGEWHDIDETEVRRREYLNAYAAASVPQEEPK